MNVEEPARTQLKRAILGLVDDDGLPTVGR
jgi:hypothetical protein